jgi:hypothetical protein
MIAAGILHSSAAEKPKEYYAQREIFGLTKVFFRWHPGLLLA